MVNININLKTLFSSGRCWLAKKLRVSLLALCQSPFNINFITKTGDSRYGNVAHNVYTRIRPYRDIVLAGTLFLAR